MVYLLASQAASKPATSSATESKPEQALQSSDSASDAAAGTVTKQDTAAVAGEAATPSAAETAGSGASSKEDVDGKPFTVDDSDDEHKMDADNTASQTKADDAKKEEEVTDCLVYQCFYIFSLLFCISTTLL